MPMRSISANGPIGKPASTSARSIVSIVPAPDRRSRNGSRVNGRFTRFTMKPGESVTWIAVFPQPFDDSGGPLGGPRRRPATGHHLDKGQHGRRIEEMEPDNALWPADVLRDGRDRQGARVRGEDRLGFGRGIEVREEGLLERQVLQGSLDHELGAGHRRRGRGRRRQSVEIACDKAVALRGVRDRSEGTPGQAVRDAAASRVDGTGPRVGKHDVPAALERDLGDARAHRPGADHGEPRSVHVQTVPGSEGPVSPPGGRWS